MAKKIEINSIITTVPHATSPQRQIPEMSPPNYLLRMSWVERYYDDRRVHSMLPHRNTLYF